MTTYKVISIRSILLLICSVLIGWTLGTTEIAYGFQLAKNSELSFDQLTDNDIQHAIQSDEIELSVKNKVMDSSREYWDIEGFARMNASLNNVFDKGLEFERIKATSDLINVFEISRDRRFITVGIKVWPFSAFTQKIEVKPNVRNYTMDLDFQEGVLEGLTGVVVLTNANDQQTDVQVKIDGQVLSKNVPMVLTASFLETASKTISQRLKENIESDSK